MTNPEIFAFLAGGGGTLLLIRLLEWHERRAVRPPQADPATPAKPWNELQRAVYEPDTAPRPASHPTADPPSKRGPGRPRKTPETPARIVSGTRATRTWVEPQVDAKKRERRKVN